ncbi:DUF397 domain-containing protein [Streptomyces sp. R28]|uniref:DUF397 domain-containing protein n=1 Tax=Streptomyces sp. R28 TaxID=3238628 RepID=A0AB39Q8I5_9ACTN
MTQLRWQKSSFSEGGADTCVEVALDSAGCLRLRESDTPSAVIAPAQSALAALIDRLKEQASSGS